MIPTWLFYALWAFWVIWLFDIFYTNYRINQHNEDRLMVAMRGRLKYTRYGRMKQVALIPASILWICWNIWG